VLTDVVEIEADQVLLRLSGALNGLSLSIYPNILLASGVLISAIGPGFKNRQRSDVCDWRLIDQYPKM
jgi:hypothetical protein